MRAGIGGCDANRSDQNPSFRFIGRPSGSVMHRCAEPRLIDCVGATADSIFSSERASPSGFRLSSAPDGSARYSGLRDTIIASAWTTNGAIMIAIAQTMKKISISTPPPLLSLSVRLRRDEDE